MRIDLDRARREPFLWQETREVAAGALERSELERLSEIEWRGRVTFTDPGFYLTGRLAYEQGLICTRCLTSFSEPVESEVELLLLVEERHGQKGTGGDEGGEEIELEEEDLGVVTLHDETFDTDPVLFEQLQLNIPMKPLCRPDCRGLCPYCGADRNAGDCACSERTVDPRWQGLAGLKESLTRREEGASEGANQGGANEVETTKAATMKDEADDVDAE